MRIGIISDTHDQIDRTRRAVDLLIAEGAEALIHCGDLTGSEIVHACSLLPCYYVFGNNDYDQSELRAAMEATDGLCLGFSGEVILAGRRVAVTHGDNNGLIRQLLGSQPDYLLYGHSHLQVDRPDGPTRRINPGALHRARTWSVATLDLETDALRFLTLDR